MTVLRATDYPDMHAAGYIPDLFAKSVRANLYAKTCLPKISVSGYLGEIKNEGESVTIATVPRVSTGKYKRGMKIPVNTNASDAIKLSIQRSRYWQQFWDRLDQHQSHLKMLEPETAKGAAAQIAEDIEAEFFAECGDMAHASNVGANAGVKSGIYNLGTAAAPQILSAKNTAAYISQFFSVIAEQNVSSGDGTKSVVIPEWARHYLVNSPDLKDASAIGEKSSLRTNRLGMIFGIEVYTSTIPAPIDVAGQTYKAWPFFACTKSALNFVVALNEVKAKEPSDMMGTNVTGVVLYDWGNVRSEGIAMGYAYPGDAVILAAS